MNARDIIINLSIHHKGDWAKIYEDISDKKHLPIIDHIDLIKAITLLDNNYPNSLKNSHNPPFVLYYKGDINLLTCSDHKVAIIGKKESNFALETEYVVDTLKDNIIVLTTANGTNINAFNRAIANRNKIILVLPCGIDNCYPKTNMWLIDKVINNGGLVISEYPHDVEATEDNFLMQNRLIAGIADDIYVIDISKESGHNITIKFALQNNKDIYVMPVSILNTELNNNKWISEGANIICRKGE